MAALSRQQTAFLDAFGFVRVKAVFSDEIDQIAEAVKALPSSTVAPDLAARQARLASLSQDDRIVGIARAVLGDDVESTRIDPDPALCRGDWHDDASGGSGRRRLMVSVILHPLHADAATIRVIPGTHLAGSSYARDVRRLLREFGGPAKAFGVDGDAMPATAIDADRGDVLVWDGGLVHASPNGVGRPRWLGLEFRERSREADRRGSG
jgi:Phytanoyl-CoA dioxygenase (PhyH)